MIFRFACSSSFLKEAATTLNRMWSLYYYFRRLFNDYRPPKSLVQRTLFKLKERIICGQVPYPLNLNDLFSVFSVSLFRWSVHLIRFYNSELFFVEVCSSLRRTFPKCSSRIQMTYSLCLLLGVYKE